MKPLTYFRLTRQLRLFALVCCGNIAYADNFSREVTVEVPVTWRKLMDKTDIENQVKKNFHFSDVIRYAAGQNCNIIVIQNAKCEMDDIPCDYSQMAIGSSSRGRACIEFSSTNDCLDELNKWPPETRYEIREGSVLGAMTDKYRRFFSRSEPLLAQPGRLATNELKSRYADVMITKMIRKEKPFTVGVVDVIMLCDQDGYKQEKTNFEKFIMSLKFSGKPLVPRTEKWLPHEDVYCDACPPEKSKQKPTVH